MFVLPEQIRAADPFDEERRDRELSQVQFAKDGAIAQLVRGGFGGWSIAIRFNRTRNVRPLRRAGAVRDGVKRSLSVTTERPRLD